MLAADVDEELADTIRTVAGQRPDLVAAISAPAPSPDAWSLHLHGEIGHLHPEELSVRLLDLSPEELATAARLLDQAKHDPDRPIPLPELDAGEPAAATESAQLPAAVEVRILGPVEIAGAGPFETNKTIELVVYLAMHRTGVNTDTLLEALWPNQPPRTARLR